MPYDPMQQQMAQATALRQPQQPAPAPTGMQTLSTPLDPSMGMQMTNPMATMSAPPTLGMQPPQAPIGLPPQAQGQGFGAGGRFGQPGGPNGNPLLDRMRPQMQAMPGQAATLQPQGTVPSPAGAARPGMPPGAPNLYR